MDITIIITGILTFFVSILFIRGVYVSLDSAGKQEFGRRLDTISGKGITEEISIIRSRALSYVPWLNKFLSSAQRFKNIDEIIKISKKYDVIGIHVFAVTKDQADAYGRNFAPIVGINEESATGTSNGALGCYLNKYVNTGKSEFILRQGYSMDKPSEIITKLVIQNRNIELVWVGGTAKII